MESVISFLNGLFSTDTIKYVVECIVLLFSICIVAQMEPLATLLKFAYSAIKWIFIGLHIISKMIYKKITKRDDFIDEFNFNFYLIIVILISSIFFLIEKGFTKNLFENGFGVKEILLKIFFLLGGGFIFIGGIAVAFAIVIGFFYAITHFTPSPETISQFLEEAENRRKEEENQKIKNEIEQLEYRRNGIKTSNSFIDDLTGTGLSRSELKRNNRRYNNLNEQINDLRNKLK